MMMAIVLITITSCLKDKGNYDYVPINQVQVAGIKTSEAYEAFAYIDSLNIVPTIVGEGLEEPGRYEYVWKFMRNVDNTADSIDHVVSRERNLKMLVTFEAGEYRGFYTVTDTREGTSWGTEFSLRVRSLTAEGFMVLSDDNGKGRLDMISNLSENEYLAAYNLWRDVEADFGTPKSIFFNYNRNPNSTLYVTDKGTYMLDKDLMPAEKNNLIWQFGLNMEQIHVKGTASTTFSNVASREVIVTGEGELFVRSIFMLGSIFEFPINKINGQSEFTPSPHIGMAIPNNPGFYWPFGHSILIYDETNDQFLELKDTNEYPSVMNFTSTSLFPVQNPGRTMVHVGSTLNHTTMAILKDENNSRHYAYEMTLGGNSVNMQNRYFELIGPEITSAKHFAVHPVLPYIFYASENKVYQFDFSQPAAPAKLVLDYSGSQIAELSFYPLVGWNPYLDWERNKAFILVVGRNLNNPSDPQNPGIVEFYTAPPLGESLVQKEKLEGFGKIIDIQLRER